MQKRKPGQPHKGWKGSARKSHQHIDPAIQLQRQEERLCTCEAVGSGEEHADWCVAEAFNRIPKTMTAERALEWIKDNRL